jgi:Domain of unknown function (DUF4440)
VFVPSPGANVSPPLERRSCVRHAITATGVSVFLLSAGWLPAQTTVHLARGQEPLDSVGTILVAQMKERSDARSRGDSATWIRTVDPRYILHTADGDVDTRDSNAASMAQDGRIAPNPMKSVDIDDIHIYEYGDMAVVTSRWIRHQRFGPQIVHATTQATSTSYRQDGKWLLVATQETFAMQEPAIVSRSTKDYDDFAGVYSWGGEFTDTITREGNHLYAHENFDSMRYELMPEGGDRFFPKGYGVESIIFRRDSTGKIVGYTAHDGGNAIAVARKVK